jgi:predicted MFS family arabinose efflux permease
VAEGVGRTVVALGTTQTLAWASSYYLPAMLAVPMARSLGVSVSTVFAAFSAALVVSAVLGPCAGRAIDRWGGKPVLIASNVVFALGLAALASAKGASGLFAAWLVIGLAMGGGLYEAAFAAVVRLYGSGSRGAITGITLFAGFASTVGWPLSSFMEAHSGWRDACLAWAALHLVLGLPLNMSLPRIKAPASEAPPSAARPTAPRVEQPSHPRRVAIILSFVFASTWFVSTAMAAHLPRLLQLTGASLAAALMAGALVGPAQVGARLLEYGFLRRLHPLLSARIAALLHPAGAGLLAIAGAPAAAAFGILHGAGNGILTIAKGTLPLALFGPDGYGERQGLLMVPARIAQAFAPLLFGFCLDRWGAGALWLSGLLSGAAFAALMFLPRASRNAPPALVDGEALTPAP